MSLILLFAPGVGLVAWLAANAYLLGREYFELAAMRFHSAAQARELRRRHAGFVFMYGAMIAVFVAIPLVNLLTPLFATQPVTLQRGGRDEIALAVIPARGLTRAFPLPYRR